MAVSLYSASPLMLEAICMYISRFRLYKTMATFVRVFHMEPDVPRVAMSVVDLNCTHTTGMLDVEEL